MKVLGIVGGVACGKSHVAKAFAKLGAVVLDADRVGHDVLRAAEVKQLLVERWGAGILSSDGEISRPAVGAIVFGNTEQAQTERRYLESLSHPRIRLRIEESLAQLRDAKTPAAILDAALLLETGLSKQCDVIVFVDVPEAIRLQRALTRGWTEQDWEKREASQLSLAVKRAAAAYCVDNSGDEVNLQAQVRKIWDELGLPL